MEIILDGQHLDATLEQERNVHEVLESLSDWVTSQGGVISEIRVNGKLRDSRNENRLDSIPLERIEKIEIRTRPRLQQNLEELTTLREYFSLMQECLPRGDRAALIDVFSEYPYVRGNLGFHLRDLFGDSGHDTFTVLDKLSGELTEDREDPLPEDLVKTASDFVRTILLVLNGRIRELSEPKAEAENVIRMLARIKGDLEQVSILLQTGKDAEAMHSIIACTEYILKAVRLLSLSPRTPEMDVFRDELNSVLRELKDAFTVKDSVLIGDLMEYEIAPKTEKLISLLEKSFLKENMQ